VHSYRNNVEVWATVASLRNHRCLWNPTKVCSTFITLSVQTGVRAQPPLQGHCEVRALAYGALCVSNKTDTSQNTYCSEYTNLYGVPYSCVVFWTSQQFCHTATLFLYECMKIQWFHNSCFASYLSLYYRLPLPWEHRHISPSCPVMSPWLRHSNFLLLIL
jgi:hypothetical protein